MSAIQSMTGYGRSTTGRFEVEVRSINHRFLDVVLKLPKGFTAIEIPLKNEVGQKFRRGRIEISVVRRSIDGAEQQPLQFNRATFDGYLKLYKELLSEFASGMRPETFEALLGDLLSRPGVIADSDSSEIKSDERDEVIRTVQSALAELEVSRKTEGAAIEKDIRSHLAELNRGLKTLRPITATTAQEASAKFTARLSQLFSDVAFDPARVAQEAGFLAERLDISEELSRLEEHLSAFEHKLTAAAPGKPLEFLVQEIGRECNTVASKSQSAPVSHAVVEMKSSLEKIREQLQNIE